MLLLRSLTGEAGEEQPAPTGRLPRAMPEAVGTDILIDGFLVGIGFAAGVKEGTLLMVAFTIELLSLGMARAVSLNQAGLSRTRNLLTNAALASMILVGALVGTLVLSRLSGDALEVVLSFGLAALLFLVTEELLVEAHEVEETPLTTATFFPGF